MSPACEEFLSLSSELTGFERIELLGTGVSDTYGSWLQESFPAPLGQLLETWRGILANDPPGGREEALRREVLADPLLGPFARAILVLWYTATWYALPADWPGTRDGTPVPNQVIPGAYPEGLEWKVAGAHPTGSKPTGFGSWGLPPEGFGSAPAGTGPADGPRPTQRARDPAGGPRAPGGS
jgi:hypothetical protein